MEDKTRLIVAVGASVAANCQPCLETAIDNAQKSGVEEKEIMEAVEIARSVKKGAMVVMDRFVSARVGNAERVDVSDDSEKACDCT